MGLPARIILGIALASLGTLIARTAFEISYQYGFYPEKSLADLTVGLLSSKLAFWLILSVVALVIWIGLELVARRWLRLHPADKHTSKNVTSALLLKDGWILNFNPKNPIGRKPISFLSDGRIGYGNNENEARWQMVNGMLEILRPNNDLQNRFRYDPEDENFICTNDTDAKGYKDQFIFRDGARAF